MTLVVFFLQDRVVKRKSKTSWTCCIGETKTCSQEERDGGHAIETLNWANHMRHVKMYIYTKEVCTYKFDFLNQNRQRGDIRELTYIENL